MMPITPSQLGKAFAYPFPVMVGSFTLFLAMIYVIAGINPLTVVAAFLHAATLDLLPLISCLAVIWFLYTVLYAATSGTFREFFQIQQDPSRASNLSPAWRVLFVSVNPSVHYWFRQSAGLPNPLRAARRLLIGMRGHPGIHPTLS